jgi:hypothetical protein
MDSGRPIVSGKDTLMKLRDGMLWMVVLAASSFVGCAVCDTCDDFPAPCVGPNCGQGGMPGYMSGPQAESMPVMGAATPAGPMNDTAGPGPMAPSSPSMPSSTTPPTPMDPAR